MSSTGEAQIFLNTISECCKYAGNARTPSDPGMLSINNRAVVNQKSGDGFAPLTVSWFAAWRSASAQSSSTVSVSTARTLFMP